MIDKQKKLESKAEGSGNNRNEERRKQDTESNHEKQTSNKHITPFRDCPNLVPIVRNITIKKKNLRRKDFVWFVHLPHS